MDVQVEGSRRVGQPPQRAALNGGRLPAVLLQGQRRLRCHRWELRWPTCAAEEVAEDVDAMESMSPKTPVAHLPKVPAGPAPGASTKPTQDSTQQK